jgi:hypothetical protein
VQLSPMLGKFVVCATAVLAALLLRTAPHGPAPAAAPPQPSLCSGGLAYEPRLSLADFTARYKVRPIPPRYLRVGDAGPLTRSSRAGCRLFLRGKMQRTCCKQRN